MMISVAARVLQMSLSTTSRRACTVWVAAITSAGCVANLDLDDSGTGGVTASEEETGETGTTDGPPADTSSSAGGQNSGTGLSPGTPPSPEAFAQARCAAIASCGCLPAGHQWTDLEVCENDLRSAWNDRFVAAAGLEVNLECWNEQLARLTGDDCTTAPPLGHGPVFEAFACDLFEGTGAVGDECGPVGDVLFVQSDCQPGLACEGGVCRTRPETGDACLASPEWDGLFAPCPGPESLRCVDGTCVPARSVGEACSAGGCSEGAYCLEGTCAPLRQEGETCTFGGECASHRCVTGACGAPVAALCGPYFEEAPPE